MKVTDIGEFGPAVNAVTDSKRGEAPSPEFFFSKSPFPYKDLNFKNLTIHVFSEHSSTPWQIAKTRVVHYAFVVNDEMADSLYSAGFFF